MSSIESVKEDGYVILKDENGDFWKVTASSKGGLVAHKLQLFEYTPASDK